MSFIYNVDNLWTISITSDIKPYYSKIILNKCKDKTSCFSKKIFASKIWLGSSKLYWISCNTKINKKCNLSFYLIKTTRSIVLDKKFITSSKLSSESLKRTKYHEWYHRQFATWVLGQTWGILLWNHTIKISRNHQPRGIKEKYPLELVKCQRKVWKGLTKMQRSKITY